MTLTSLKGLSLSAYLLRPFATANLWWLSMTKEFQPLLSASLPTDNDDVLLAALKKLSYPTICSPKIDGIRVFSHPELGAVTRKLKPLPNALARNLISSLPGADGEITAGGEEHMTDHDIFNTSQSFAMTHHAFDESPTHFTYSVFDYCESGMENIAYEVRLDLLRKKFERGNPFPWVRLHDTFIAQDPTAVLEYEAACLEIGYEGIMLRYPRGPYKFGRSTLKQQILIKLKRMADGEATIVGFEPLYKNENELTKDERGYAKRSAHNENMVEMPMVGALIVQMGDMTFNVGSGFDHETRSKLWDERDTLAGKIITFKYQATGMKDVPRFPIFKGFRSD